MGDRGVPPGNRSTPDTTTRAHPKSPSLHTKPRASRGLDRSSTLPGLRSQCASLAVCRWRSASAISSRHMYMNWGGCRKDREGRLGLAGEGWTRREARHWACVLRGTRRAIEAEHTPGYDMVGGCGRCCKTGARPTSHAMTRREAATAQAVWVDVRMAPLIAPDGKRCCLAMSSPPCWAWSPGW